MFDVIVVGAGLSGLVCARRLAQRGANVIVLEARDRVGGRLHTGTVGGAVVDLGGQWITPGQHRVFELAHELGIATIVHERHGRAVLEESERSWLRRTTAALAQWSAMRRIERLPEHPDFDSVSLRDWLATTIRNRIARDRIQLHADLIFACDPSELSLLYYQKTLRATGGFAPEGADSGELRVVGGAQSLALRIADSLGDRIHLSAPIEAIEDTGASVIARGAATYEAKQLVLAIPPTLVRRLAIELPPAARRYVDLVHTGRVIKCFAAYPRAFWRDVGLSGEQYRVHGAVRATVELAGAPPALLAFIVGREAARWATRDPAERRAEVLAVFGDPDPLDYLEVDWGVDPWSGGCVACLPPNSLGARWGESHGRVHFAGTETARAWPGYMEGAIEAGERAAELARE